MDLKKIVLTALPIVAMFMAKAQTMPKRHNPYESIGKRGTIVTANGDLFIEVFDYDSIQRIGSVMFNIYKFKITQLLNGDSLFSQLSDNSSASRWYSVDPLVDRFPSWSPYNFVYNNPIRFVDPDGRAPLDDYQLDKKTGMIVMIRETTDDHDVLFASKDNGKVDNGKSVNVQKGVLNNIKEGTVTADGKETGFSYLKTSEAQGSSLFEFLADNSNIEWGITKFSDGENYVTTSREWGRELGGTGIITNVPGLAQKNVTEHDHSHPGGIDYPSGMVPEGMESTSGDVASAKAQERRFPNSNIKFNIYTPSNGKYHP